MFITLLFTVLLSIAIAPYLNRLILLLYSRSDRCNQKTAIQNTAKEAPPKISMILPVYNEEKLIVRKINNLLSLKYPTEKLEIIIVDGNSSDKTIELIKSFKDPRIILIQNQKREGVTQATIDGVKVSSGEIVILTDTEALLEPDALEILTENLNDPQVGAVSGMEKIVNPKENTITKMEQTHRSFYDLFSISESRLHSTAYFRGEFAAIRKQLFPIKLGNKGILDVEIAISAIKSGFRAKCDPMIRFYSLAANKITDRNRQKIQRATLNQECIFKNRRLLLLPNFYGRVIFPSMFAIHLISPIFFLIAILLSPMVVLELPWMVNAIFVFSTSICFILPKTRIILLTFLQSQIYLTIGIFKAIFGRAEYLRQVESTRKPFDLPSKNNR